MRALNDYAAVLFDMDGTLLDSTACVEGIWRRWAARRGTPGLTPSLRGPTR